MMQQRIEKVKARAEHLLDLFLALRGKYAMLKPLAFDPSLAKRVGSGPRATGYVILRNALYHSCIQDLVKLTLDTDRRSPSVSNLMKDLVDSSVKASCREEYSRVPDPIHVGPGDPLPPELLAEIRSREEEQKSKQFDEIWEELSSRWSALAEDGRLQGFKVWRDKLIAHADLHHTDGQYHLTDLSTLSLRWGDLGYLMEDLQEVVERVNLVARSASFAWTELDRQLQEASGGFWSLLGEGE
jgi:hypothetical protein